MMGWDMLYHSEITFWYVEVNNMYCRFRAFMLNIWNRENIWKSFFHINSYKFSYDLSALLFIGYEILLCRLCIHSIQIQIQNGKYKIHDMFLCFHVWIYSCIFWYENALLQCRQNLFNHFILNNNNTDNKKENLRKYSTKKDTLVAYVATENVLNFW